MTQHNWQEFKDAWIKKHNLKSATGPAYHDWCLRWVALGSCKSWSCKDHIYYDGTFEPRQIADHHSLWIERSNKPARFKRRCLVFQPYYPPGMAELVLREYEDILDIRIHETSWYKVSKTIQIEFWNIEDPTPEQIAKIEARFGKLRGKAATDHQPEEKIKTLGQPNPGGFPSQIENVYTEEQAAKIAKTRKRMDEMFKFPIPVTRPGPLDFDLNELPEPRTIRDIVHGKNSGVLDGEVPGEHPDNKARREELLAQAERMQKEADALTSREDFGLHPIYYDEDGKVYKTDAESAWLQNIISSPRPMSTKQIETMMPEYAKNYPKYREFKRRTSGITGERVQMVEAYPNQEQYLHALGIDTETGGLRPDAR